MLDCISFNCETLSPLGGAQESANQGRCKRQKQRVQHEHQNVHFPHSSCEGIKSEVRTTKYDRASIVAFLERLTMMHCFGPSQHVAHLCKRSADLVWLLSADVHVNTHCVDGLTLSAANPVMINAATGLRVTVCPGFLQWVLVQVGKLESKCD